MSEKYFQPHVFLESIRQQKLWIKSCGETLEGYIEKYGDSGDGAHAIYAADIAHLKHLEGVYVRHALQVTPTSATPKWSRQQTYSYKEYHDSLLTRHEQSQR